METSFRYVREQLEIKGKNRNEKEFYCNYKKHIKKKNIPKYCFEIIEKDGSTCFLRQITLM